MSIVETENRPPAEWRIPSCGVHRSLLIGGVAEQAAKPATIDLIAREIAGELGQPKAAPDLAAVLGMVRPSNRLLEEIFRHAFHPDHVDSVAEALVCPRHTRARQLAAALYPVIAAARRRVAWP